MKKEKKQQRKGSSLASVTKASVTSINHVIVHLKASLAEKEHQAGTCNDLAGDSGDPCLQSGEDPAPSCSLHLHTLIPAKLRLIKHRAQTSPCRNGRCQVFKEHSKSFKCRKKMQLRI